jgi:hypothetical protein
LNPLASIFVWGYEIALVYLRVPRDLCGGRLWAAPAD